MTRFEIKPMPLAQALVREKELLLGGYRLNSTATSEWDLRLDEFMKFHQRVNPSDPMSEIQIGFRIFSSHG